MSTDHDLREVLRDVLAGEITERLDQAETGVGFDAELWAKLSDLGFTALTAPEDRGGSGAGWPEAAALLTESAAAARHLPFAESDLLAHWLLRTAGVPAADPTTPLTIALVDPDGTARSVPWLGHVPAVLVIPRPDGTWSVRPPDYARDQPPENARNQLPENWSNRVPENWSNRVPENWSNRVPENWSNRVTHSGVPRGDLFGVEAVDGDAVVGDAVVGGEVVDRLVLRAALARAVQVVGALDRAVELCVEHARTRVQFGRPLAKFQAVQHLVADAAAEAALARAAVDAAVLDAAETDLAGPASATKVAAARSCAGHAASVVVRNAHQVHGAIGTTREHPLQLVTLPALDWRGEFGTTRDWDRFLGRSGPLWDVVLGAPAEHPPIPGGHR
ncbi:acyl-CoA dehydrogenase family protein [Saccharopolyspora sp. TS4A08]|uniref:Acyl-CoA dehydrogenase family protein n=1 Tax=Saccharopolyspora ipomoeae TaxID=3042027 RepID=A0ABT6PR06_9PSEU|nr:acyl-CoA dehydrogenase family protein [Saccharopolyspora sp. TS4A08]MDI2030098.1 acyl-CoA dehydrogenase family protein [Saccharopolyspora sp. TS4A08]